VRSLGKTQGKQNALKGSYIPCNQQIVDGMNDMPLAKCTEARGTSYQMMVGTSYFEGHAPFQVTQHQ
jgi:hypothetical protein